VRGNLLQARDPLGLDTTEWDLFEGVVAGVLETGMAALDSATDLEGAVEAVKQYAEAVEAAYERDGVVGALEEGNPILRSTRAVQEEVAAAEAAIERGDATAVGESLGRVVAAAAPFIPRRLGGRRRGMHNGILLRLRALPILTLARCRVPPTRGRRSPIPNLTRSKPSRGSSGRRWSTAKVNAAPDVVEKSL
jgi:hypothetical protein